MDTSKYKVGDVVKFIGDRVEEYDQGEVIMVGDGQMRVAWDVAKEVHDEDPYDDRIFLISRKA